MLAKQCKSIQSKKLKYEIVVIFKMLAFRGVTKPFGPYCKMGGFMTSFNYNTYYTKCEHNNLPIE